MSINICIYLYHYFAETKAKDEWFWRKLTTSTLDETWTARQVMHASRGMHVLNVLGTGKRCQAISSLKISMFCYDPRNHVDNCHFWMEKMQITIQRIKKKLVVQTCHLLWDQHLTVISLPIPLPKNLMNVRLWQQRSPVEKTMTEIMKFYTRWNSWNFFCKLHWMTSLQT